MSWLNDFMFLRPWWFLALLPLAFYWWWLRQQWQQGGRWSQWVDAHLLRYLQQQLHAGDRAKSGGRGGHRRRGGLLALSFVIVVIALAGPALRTPVAANYARETARVVLLDMSASMRADDVKPSRLARARLKILDWLQVHNEGHTALVVYAGSAHVLVPFSDDTRTLAALIPTLNTELMPVSGNDPLSALQLIDHLRQQAGFARVEVLWLCDGISPDQEAALSAALRSLPLRVGVLALGTAEGVPVQNSQGGWLTDAQGKIIFSKQDWPLWEQFAANSGAKLAALSADDSDWKALEWNDVLQDESRVEQEQGNQQRSLQWQELGGWLCLLLIPLALFAFRRAYLLMILGLSLLGFAPAPAHASWWLDLWQTADQQGAQALREGDTKTAAQKFDSKDWRGVAQYRGGDFAAAAESFAAADVAQEKLTPQQQAAAHYNRGNALARAQHYEDALKEYDAALQQQADMQAARDNRAAVERFMKQQAQKQRQQQQQQQQQQQPASAEEQQQQNQASPQNEKTRQQDGKPEAKQSPTQANGAEKNSPATQGHADDQQGQQDTARADQQNEKSQAAQKPGGPVEKKQAEKNQKDGGTKASASEQDTSQAKPEDPEVEAMLRQLPDDPGQLLRRRMLLELQRRGEKAPPQDYEHW